MEYEIYELDAIEGFAAAIESYRNNLNKISTGRANPGILNNVKVMYYGSITPLNEIAAITSPEARQLLIKPFDASSVKEIVAAINSASLGLNPVNEGHQVRIALPELTSEKRKEMVKSLAHYTEQARIQIRLVRQNANKMIKADGELSEDESKNYLDQIQKLVDKYNAIVENITLEKEAELLNI